MAQPLPSFFTSALIFCRPPTRRPVVRAAYWGFVAVVLLLGSSMPAWAVPLTGTKTIPGTYATLALAIADLNTQGVGAGGVIFNVAAGHTETFGSPTAGNITATGTAANPITFQKDGAGANPLITAGTGTLSDDAIIKLVGADYVTFDGIDVQDDAANNNANKRMEYGFALRVASATDGAQNNTIKNCTITLIKANTNQCYGIAVQAKNATGTGTAQTNTTTGSNKNNVFISNTLTNMATAFLVEGTSAAQPDAANEVGQTGLGNTGTNLGGNFGSMAIAVEANGQSGLKIVGNSFTSAATGNTNASTFHGINIRTTCTGQVDITGNAVTITDNNTGGNTAYVIRNQSTAVTPLNINGNTLQGTYTTGSGTMYGILSANVATLNIGTTTGNTIQNMNLSGGGTLFCIDGGSPTTTLSVQNNIIQGTTLNGPLFYGIYNNASTNVPTTISGNQIINNTAVTATTTAYGIYLGTAVVSRNITISNNLIKSLTNLSSNDGLYGIYDEGVSPGTNPSTETISNNKIWSLTGTGNAIVTGIFAKNGASSASSPVVTIQGNSVKALTGPGTGIVTGIDFYFGANGSSVTQDSVVGLSSQRAAIGISAGSTNGATTTQTVSQNVVGNLTSTTTNAAATPIGIRTTATNTSNLNITRNKVYGLSNSAATTTAGAVTGILVSSTSGTTTVTNNIVGNLTAPTANGDDVVRGISLVTGTINCYYNTVYLPASTTSSGGTFGSSGIFTSTVPTVDLRDNLVVNLSVFKGAGRSVGHRRSGTALTNFSSTSDYNLWYAGTASANNLIYYDGTNSDQTLAAYKTRVSTREANAKTENVAFASTTSTSTTFLHIDPTVVTVVESGGVAIGGLTDDFDATSVRTGYPLGSQTNGGGTAPDIGADEGDFSPYDVGVTALAAPSGTQPPCYGSAETVTVTVTNFGGGPLTFSAAVPLVLTGSVNGPSGVQALTTTNITSGSIAAGGTANFSFSSTINMSSVGLYTFTVAADVTNTLAGLTTDLKASNNTLASGNTRTVLVKPTASLNAITDVCDGTTATLTGNILTSTGPWILTYTIDGVAQTPVNLVSSFYSITTPVLTLPGNPKTIAITGLTDSRGCSAVAFPASQTVTIEDLPTFGTSKVDVTCNGANNGTITVTAAGGSGSYEFSKNNGSTWVAAANPHTFTGLTPAIYQIKVRNASSLNCEAAGATAVTITEPTAISATTTPTPTTCPGGNDGQLTVNASGGTGTLEYSINSTTVYQPSNVFTGLSAVNATIRVRDANLCVFVLTGQNPGSPTAFSVSPVATASTVCVGGTTTVTVTASGGTGTLEYSIDNGASYQPSNVFSGVTSGSKLVRVRDASLCVSGAASVVISTTTTTTWNGSVNNDWYNASNWSHCVPSSGIDAVIPTASTVDIGSGTADVRDLDIQGSAVLTVTGTGNLDVYRTFTTASGTSFQPSVGTTHFRGTGAQAIPAATYVDVTVTGATAKVLTGNVNIAGTLDLAAGMVRLDNFDLLLTTASSSITGAGASHFVVTDGTGRLGFAQVGSGGVGTVTFPIGSTTASTDYTPATLTNAGSQDTFYAFVTDDIPQGVVVQPGGPHVVKKTWDIAEAVAGGSNATLTLAWNAANEGAFFDRTLSAVSHFVSGVWDHPFMGWGPATSLGGMRYSRVRAGLTSFSPYAIQDANLPLPVELTRFTAVRQPNNDVALAWEAASESNSKGYEVQVSAGQNRGSSSWRPLGFVNSETPNSNSARRYRFTDTETNKAGVRYYRLKQVDLDGNERISSVQTVKFGGVTEPTLMAWPNPFFDNVTVELGAVKNSTAELTLVDGLGRIVFRQTEPVTAGVQQLPLIMPVGLPAGAYVLTISIDGVVLRNQLVRQ